MQCFYILRQQAKPSQAHTEKGILTDTRSLYYFYLISLFLMKRILIFTFSLLYEDCIFSINSIFYTHNYTLFKKLFSALCFLGHNKDKTNISQKQVFCLYFIAKMKKKLISCFQMCFSRAKKQPAPHFGARRRMVVISAAAAATPVRWWL